MIRTKHPEDTCERCGRTNRSWVVDSDRFNSAMRGLGLDRSAIVCPVCFIEGHQADTGLICSWELVPATTFRPADEVIPVAASKHDGQEPSDD